MRGVKARGPGTSSLTIEQGHVDDTTGDVVWRWGVDTFGRPYFDTDGVDVGEEARLLVDDGVFYAEEVTL